MAPFLSPTTRGSPFESIVLPRRVTGKDLLVLHPGVLEIEVEMGERVGKEEEGAP